MHKLSILFTILLTLTFSSPAFAVTPTQDPSSSSTKHIVKAKETLSHIASNYKVTVESIVNLNDLANPHKIQIGQVLNLPISKQNETLASRSDDERTRESTYDDLAAEVIDYAKEFLGCSYSYGADGPKSFDCSGLTMYVFKHFDIDLPHNSASQSKKGSQVKRNDLIPGDLVFFNTSNKGISHVGLYIGNGDFVHASTGGGKVEITSLSATYYKKRYVTARRILE